MIRPINDLCKVEVASKNKKLVQVDKDTFEHGILVELPDKFNFFGFWSFAFENSFMSREQLDELYNYYSGLIGQRVYWTALSEKGNIIKEGDNNYAFVKLTSLIAADDDPNGKARNIHSDGKGAYNI